MAYVGNQPYQVAFVTDTFSGTGSTTAFTMSVAPANTSSVLVAITGVLQDPSTYGVTGNTINFSTAPPSGTSNISCRYLGIPASGVTTTAYRTVTEFTATAGQTTFTPPSYTVGFINVYRNGSRLGSADYTATNGTTVVLASAATSGDLVTVESFLVSSVLNAIPATAGSVGSTYIASGAVGTTQLASGAVTQSILGTNVAGNGPAFSYYASSITAMINSWTKISYATSIFDTTGGWYNSSTSRFTPSLAGYYLISATNSSAAAFTAANVAFSIYKNGSEYIRGSCAGVSSAQVYNTVTGIVYFNGTGDYVEIYQYQSSGSSQNNQTGSINSPISVFQGVLIRSA